jgi:hypothetical protein
MLLTLIGIGVAVAFTLGAYWLRTRRARKGAPRQLRAPRTGGVATLRHRRGRWVSMALLALAPTALVTSVAIVFGRRSGGAAGFAFAALVVTAGFAVTGWCLGNEFRRRTLVDDDGIDAIGVFTRKKVRWADVARFAYNAQYRWFFVVSRTGERLWIWEDLIGIGDFAELALAHLPRAVLGADRDAREVLDEIAAEAKALAGSGA